ncbi:SRPBCC family protein [Conexibacter sp. CPCC 206217]|uniref:SRPBCC family protein n=1 Tax=Conexibacter sp. CPCC 206217 TaxID=3064574 RepID=UPI0027226BD9|nr:SRPBCC family protein [Conexibacter sp. CPCC 206217]MDO8210626.1 SRPBCC family protein [Conexibacter sp. CPCC 206217]
MRFDNGFVVQAPIEEVWATLLDVERVAPCMPGAEVLERESEDRYRVAIRVKVGPVSMRYRGEVQIVERDDDAHRATMRVKAKEARGQGTADAHVRMALDGDGADGGTRATMETEVQMSGKVAAMGQGVIADVSARLVETFAGNLAAMLEGGGQEEQAAAAAVPTPAAATGSASSSADARGSAPATPSNAGATAAGDATATVTSDAPRSAPKPTANRSTPAPQADSSLPVGKIAAGVIAGRLSDPRVLLTTTAGLALAAGAVGFLLGRRKE